MFFFPHKSLKHVLVISVKLNSEFKASFYSHPASVVNYTYEFRKVVYHPWLQFILHESMGLDLKVINFLVLLLFSKMSLTAMQLNKNFKN